MKIGLITSFSNNYSAKQNPRANSPVLSHKVSFKGDSSEAIDEARKFLKSFNNKYEKFSHENSVPKEYASSLDEIHDREEQNRELNQLLEECRIINEMLDTF